MTGTEAIAIRVPEDRQTIITVLSPNGKYAFLLKVHADDNKCGAVYVTPGDNKVAVYGAGELGEAAIRIVPIYSAGAE